MNTDDHDMVIGMAKDLNHLVEWTKQHTTEDDEKHRDNLKKFEGINKVIYGMAGVLVFVEIISKFIH